METLTESPSTCPIIQKCPSLLPSPSPTFFPSTNPSPCPSCDPSFTRPSFSPSPKPSPAPVFPSLRPTKTPSVAKPSPNPSLRPKTPMPSYLPSPSPISRIPTLSPNTSPLRSLFPSKNPTLMPNVRMYANNNEYPMRLFPSFAPIAPPTESPEFYYVIPVAPAKYKYESLPDVVVILLILAFCLPIGVCVYRMFFGSEEDSILSSETSSEQSESESLEDSFEEEKQRIDAALAKMSEGMVDILQEYDEVEEEEELQELNFAIDNLEVDDADLKREMQNLNNMRHELDGMLSDMGEVPSQMWYQGATSDDFDL